MGAPFQYAAADHAAAFLEVEAVQQFLVEGPPGRRAEIEIPIDLFPGRLGLGRKPMPVLADRPAGRAWTV